MWTSGMTCQMYNLFKFKPGTDVAVPCGLIMERGHRIYDLPITYYWPPNRPDPSVSGTTIWRDKNNDGQYQANEYDNTSYGYSYGYYVDKSGNFWQAGNPIIMRKATFDQYNNLVYNDSDVKSFQISGISDINKVVYQEDKDRIMLLTTGCRDLKGGVIYAVDNWSSGNRNARRVGDLKNTNDPSSFYAAGDYVFEVGYSSHAKVWITKISDGSLVGTLEPSAAIGGINRTGSMDIGNGIVAYQRKNGEYEVFLEDDYLSRVILYRWCPTGNCSTPVCSTAPAIPSSLSAAAANGQVTLSWTCDACATSYNILRSTTSGGPYTTVKMGVTSTSYTDASLTNNTAYYYVVNSTNSVGTSSNSSQVTATPNNNGPYDLIITDISWSPSNPQKGNAVTFSAVVKNSGGQPTTDGVIIGVAFSVNGTVVSCSDNSSTSLAAGASRTLTANNCGVTWTAGDNGTYTILANVDDINRLTDEANESNNTLSKTLSVSSGVVLRDPENPSNTVNGLNYNYYETNGLSSLPDFSTLTSVKIGTSTTGFDIGLRNREDNFEFRFTGYVDIPSDGTYTFYTNSDDGSRLYIGSTLVVDNDGLHGATEKSGAIGLKQGKHTITVTFFEKDGGQSLSVSYSSPSLTKTSVPTSSLYIVGDPVDPAGTITAKKASSVVTVDGSLSESSWNLNKTISKVAYGSTTNTATFGSSWDNTYLYIGVKVLDDHLYSGASNVWKTDAVEIYIDSDHNKGTSYDSHDRQYIKGYNTTTLFASGSSTGVLHAWSSISGGYSVEIAIPWSNLGLSPSAGTTIGIDVGFDDYDSATDTGGQNVWNGDVNDFNNTSKFGNLVLSSNITGRESDFNYKAKVNLKEKLSQEEINTLQIYPNPAIEEVVIISNQEMKNITFFNIVGSTAYLSEEVNTKDYKVDIRRLKPGVYIIRVETKKGTLIKRLVVQ